MDMHSLEEVVGELNAASVRYLVAGGLAVAVHGHLRFTADLDLVVQLDTSNIVLAFEALARQGYRPSVPVGVGDFADPNQRRRWIDERGMQVLNFFSDRHRTMPVDIFVSEPFAFESEYASVPTVELAPGLSVRFVSIETLIVMKRHCRSGERSRRHRALEHCRRRAKEADLSSTESADDWESGTWHGARRAQIREYLKMTVRERLEAVAAMSSVAAALQRASEDQRIEPPPAP